MRSPGLATLSLLALVWASDVAAAPIASRSALQSLLVVGTLEDFEGFAVGAGAAANLDCTTLDAAAVCNGQGPGLVVPGFSVPMSVHGQWNGAGYFGSTSRELLAGDPELVIDFNLVVQAFGFDLRAFTGFPATATVTVFAPDDTTPIGTLGSIVLATSGVAVFAGWEDLSGIGRVVVTQTGPTWTPPVDNLEFGIVPEPSTFSMLALALAALAVARRRPH